MGLLGGLAAEALQWYKIRHRLKVPAYAAKLLYWITTVVMVLLGGGLAVAYAASGLPLTPLLAINVGVTAPLMFATASKNVPTAKPEVA